MDIIHISWILYKFCGHYPNFVDTILIGNITSDLACNVSHVQHSFVLVLDNIFVYITSYVARNVQPISHSLLI